ncbi:MAG: hypothetical protein WC901_04635 [Candidatus Margulisiibacteriota bacterium]
MAAADNNTGIFWRNHAFRNAREDRFKYLCRTGRLDGAELLELVDYLYRHYRFAILLYIRRWNDKYPQPFHENDEDILQEAFLRSMKLLKKDPTWVTCSFFTLLSISALAAIGQSGRSLRPIIRFREKRTGRKPEPVIVLPFGMSVRQYHEI